MNRVRTISSLGAWCCTVGALGCSALVALGCGSPDAPRSLQGQEASPQPAPGGVTPGSTGLDPANAAPAGGTAPGGAAPAGVDTSSEAAANEAPDVNELAPPAEGAEGEPPAESTGATEGEAPTESELPAENTEGEASEAPEEIDPSSDENLRFILDDGFETTYFSVHCSAIGEDGSEIDGDTVTELPVGGGFILQCNLDSLPSRATTDVLSAADEPWCALGVLTSFETGGDERLDITLVSPPDSPSPTLIATREGEPINLQLASAFGAPLWPVWLVTTYDAIDVARAQQGKLCDEVFEL